MVEPTGEDRGQMRSDVSENSGKREGRRDMADKGRGEIARDREREEKKERLFFFYLNFLQHLRRLL